MAFTLKRKKRIKEELRLVDANDNIVKVIEIDFDVDSQMHAFNKAQNAVIRAEQALSNAATEEAQIAYGNAVIGILNVIFGEENAKEILAFYENRYVELTEEVLPFIAEVFMPEMKKRQKEKRDRLAKKYASEQR